MTEQETHSLCKIKKNNKKILFDLLVFFLSFFFLNYSKEGFVVKTLIYDFNEKTHPTTNSSDLQSDRLHAQH